MAFALAFSETLWYLNPPPDSHLGPAATWGCVCKHRVESSGVRSLRANCLGQFGMRSFDSLWLRCVATTRATCLLLGLTLVGLASGCANIGGVPPSENVVVDEDPLEGFNRQMFAVNLTIDTFLLRPAAVAYRELMPQAGKYVIRNFVNNLKLPWTFLNDLAQGETSRAGVALARFVVNSTLGIGGLFDPATDLDLPYHQEDFGQTLAVWGVENGPYLVLPVFGPSSFRDAIGTAVAYVADPVKIGAHAADLDDEYLGTQVADAVDSRYRSLGTIDSLRTRSLDFYATVRSLYMQRRADEIKNGGSDISGQGTLLTQNVAPGEPHGGVDGKTVLLAEASPVTAVDLGPTPPQVTPSEAHPVVIAALPPSAATDTGSAMADASVQKSHEPLNSHEASEPSGQIGGSHSAGSIRAFDEAARAYESALISMRNKSNGTVPTE